ncbi:MAG: hypothetical protein EXS31_06195 [Pedosphaera sp.]|nr:hypothetical protein [Pedosphaera sp.]
MKAIETKMPFRKFVSRWPMLRVLVLGIFLAAHAWLAPTAWAQWENYEPYTFTTLAGSAGVSSVDWTGSAARFRNPLGVAVDIESSSSMNLWEWQVIGTYVLEGGTNYSVSPTQPQSTQFYRGHVR